MKKIDSGRSIKYKNKYFRPLHTSGEPVCFKKGRTALVIEAFYTHSFANGLDQLYTL